MYIYIYILVRESVKTETTRDHPKEDVEERRRVLLLKEAFLGSLRARSKDRAIDTSSPQSTTGDRLDLRTTSNNNNNNKKEREKKNRCNNRKSSTLLTLRCSRGTSRLSGIFKSLSSSSSKVIH